MMVMLSITLPLEGIVLGTVTGWWKQEVVVFIYRVDGAES
jgi:hypothetical protein